MEYRPFLDAFKYSLAPTELQDRWNELDSYVYVISKTVFLVRSKTSNRHRSLKSALRPLVGRFSV